MMNLESNQKEDLKYKYWVLTVSPTKNCKLMTSEELQILLKEVSEEYVFQKEEASNIHFQCVLSVSYRMRKRTLLQKLSVAYEEELFTLDNMRSDWEQAVAYCTKEEGRIDGPWTSNITNLPISEADFSFLSQKDRRYPWQRDLLEKILEENEVNFKTPDDRTIIWITDPQGNSGKSKLVKWLFVSYSGVSKVSFGTANQLRSALIATGRKVCYLIDMPRTLGTDDSVASVLSAIEDLKNGFLVSSMYGKNQTLLLDPPHIIIFSNRSCPRDGLSQDRWDIYYIEDKELIKHYPGRKHIWD